MALEFFQYQVNRRWYRLYWGIMFGFSMLFVGTWVAAHYVAAFHPYAYLFAVDLPSLALAGLTLIYLVTAFWYIARRSLPLATLVGSMLFVLVLMHGLSSTDPANAVWPYVAGWLTAAFLGGIYGLPLLAGSVFLTAVYVILQSNFSETGFSRPSILLIVGSIVLCTLAYFFWKTRYQSIEEQRLSQLSGMLQNNQQQSEILVQSIADGIIMIDTSGKITLINPAAAAMSQWSIADAVGVDVNLVIKLHKEDGSELDSDQNPFKTVFAQKGHINLTAQLESRQRKAIIISLSVSPILGADQKPLSAVAVIRDISEERAAEKQRGEFISTASHEMRTPVAAIEGYLALALNDKVSTIDSRARGFLEKAHASTQHLGKLFQDLLTSSKAEDGRLSNHPAVVEMGVFMQQLTDDLKFAAEKKGLLAEFVIGGADETIDATTKDASVQHLVKPLYYVNVDPDRMREVITNLFDNACKYTDTGKVSIGLTGNNEVVQLYVRDTGAGIPAEDIPHLFQKFYRVDNSATRTIGGTGLGLFISRKIVELYRGRIWVESEVGKGSTFFINLPRLTTQRANELQSAETTLGGSSINAGGPGPTTAKPPALPSGKS